MGSQITVDFAAIMLLIVTLSPVIKSAVDSIAVWTKTRQEKSGQAIEAADTVVRLSMDWVKQREDEFRGLVARVELLEKENAQKDAEIEKLRIMVLDRDLKIASMQAEIDRLTRRANRSRKPGMLND